MDVNADYESIKIHEVPKDWTYKFLGDLGKIVRGGSPRPAGDPKYFNGNFIPWLTVAGLTNIAEHQLEITGTESFLTKEGARHSRTLPAGTVILANSGATLGVAKILSINSCANDGIAAIINQIDGDKRFVCQFINTQTRHLRDVIATGNGQPNLNTKLIRDIAIPFPPLPEQRAIADALSDVDALLGALDRLIAKKRDLKQAAMQQLLTGQTRLPGFDGEWEVKQFKSLLRFQVGFPFASSFFNENADGIRLIRNRDLKSNDQIVHYSGTYDEAFIVRDGDVLVGMDGDFCPCQWRGGLSLLNQRVGRLLPRAGLSSTFIFYAIAEPLKRIETTTAGTTVKHLSHGNIDDITRPMPGSPEQTAIAKVLFDIDTELEAIETRRAKTAALKQGMMQELLTGRTRLV